MNYSKRRLLSRVLVNVFIFFFSFQQIAPAYASILSDGRIESDIAYDPQFEFVDQHSYLYKALDHIEQSAPSLKSVESLLKTLKLQYRHVFDRFVWVPIAVSDITIFVEAIEHYKQVGSPAVQSRYVRKQLNSLLGRSLINPADPSYGSEKAQLNTLYANTISFVSSNPSLRFGQKLNVDQTNSQLGFDLIWPELRLIDGQEVIVPVVYLTKATYDARKVTGNVTEVYGDVSLNSLNIEDVEINFERSAFLSVTNSLVNLEGSITGAQSLTISVGKDLRNLSGVISSQDDLTILANSITNRTLVHRVAAGNSQSTYFSNVASIDAVNGNLVLDSYGDIFFSGAEASAGQSITLQTNGSIYLGPIRIVDGSETLTYNTSSTDLTISYLQSGLTAGEAIELIAAQEIKIDAAELVAERGHIDILAGLGIVVENELGEYSRNFNGRFGKKKVTESVYQTVAIRSLLDAGKGIRLNTEFGDITLRAAEINSVEGTRVKATNGAVNLLMTTETDHYAYSSVKKGLFTTKTVNRGHEIETGVSNTIVGGFAVEALSGVNVEYEGLRGLDCEDYLAEVGESASFNEDPCLRANVLKISEMPGMEWMGEVLALADADPEAYSWDEITYKHKTWSESNTSLSPAFMAVISIAVAIAAGPAGAAMASTITGTAVTTATIAAGTAGTLATAISAGTVALISQATVATANGVVNDDIGGAMEAFASEDTFKSLAISMVTAGAIAELDAAIFEVDTQKIQDVTGAAEAIGATSEQIQAAIDAIGPGPQSLGGQIGQAVIHASTKSSVDFLIEGGNSDDLEQSFFASLSRSGINHLGQYMAQSIGSAFDQNPLNELDSSWLDTALKYISHAGAGCILGVANGEINGSSENDTACAVGAGGAVVGELIGSIYRNSQEIENAKSAIDGLISENSRYIEELQSLGYDRDAIMGALNAKTDLLYYTGTLDDLKSSGVDLARLGSAIGAFAAGADAAEVNIAGDLGANSAENNAFFLLAALPVILTGIDIVLTGADLLEVYEAYDRGDIEEGDRLLALFVGGAVVGAVIPGDKLLESIVNVAAASGKTIGKNADRVIDYVKGKVTPVDVPDNVIPLRNQLGDLTPDEHALIQSVGTFEALGVDNSDALKFIQETDDGRAMFELALQSAGQDADLDVVLNRVSGFVETGVDLPRLIEVESPLVKIVPTGTEVSGYSPYFTTPRQIELAKESGRPFADFFGLPAISDSARYDLYELSPKDKATVFESVIAPTSELGGKLTTNGGGVQLIVPDRSQFEAPKLLEVIDDNL